MRTKLLLFILLVFYFTIGCVEKKSDADLLLSWMTGSFSSAEQAKMDSNFYDISLEMVQIWKDRTDGPWIYVEQALTTRKENPYRQRVYQLVQENEKFKSIVYSFKHDTLFAGDYKKENPLNQLTPDSLIIREGCAVILQKISDDTFQGSTKDRDCVSLHRGATYATSEVTIKEERIISWDRGFDLNDNQVWGAEKGGYIFIKQQKQEN